MSRVSANIPDRLRGVLTVRAFIERCESRLQRLPDDVRKPPRDRAGFTGWDSATGTNTFLFTPDGFAEACGGQDSRETARELHARGFLVTRENGHRTEKRMIGGAGSHCNARATHISYDDA